VVGRTVVDVDAGGLEDWLDVGIGAPKGLLTVVGVLDIVVVEDKGVGGGRFSVVVGVEVGAFTVEIPPSLVSEIVVLVVSIPESIVAVVVVTVVGVDVVVVVLVVVEIPESPLNTISGAYSSLTTIAA
jgi:hypothetical protein